MAGVTAHKTAIKVIVIAPALLTLISLPLRAQNEHLLSLAQVQ